MHNSQERNHPPWYARGTPVINPRDGPTSPARGTPFFSSQPLPRARSNPLPLPHTIPRDGSRGKRGNTWIFNDEESWLGRCYVQPRRGVKIIEVNRIIVSKPRRGARIIADAKQAESKPRRGAMIIVVIMLMARETRRVDMIIEQHDERQKYHPLGVPVLPGYLCYNPTIPRGITNSIRQIADAMIIVMIGIIDSKTRRVDTIIDDAMQAESKPRRGAMIIVVIMLMARETRRVDMIIEQHDERQKYHPLGVPVLPGYLCYNPTIPRGITNSIRQIADAMIITDAKQAESKPRRGVKIIEWQTQ